jgi:hypothetical protein
MEQVNSPAASQALLRLIAGSWVAQAIYVVARLGIADLLQGEPKSSAALAEATGVHPRALYRVLRSLASLGVFAEDNEARFSLTPLAEPLQSGVPGSLKAFAIMMGSEWVWRSWGEILHSVETERPAFEHVYGAPLFEYYAKSPDAARIGIEGLTSRSLLENAAVVSSYDFSAVRTVVDVGGGQGTLLAAILKAHPTTRGMLFDMPHVVAAAKPIFEQAGVLDRCDLVGGNFFEAVPPGGEVYILKKVIHDWDDQQAQSILRACRAAMPEEGRLLLVELVIPPGNEPSFGKLLDLLMLVYPGGRERTEIEHRDLLASAGFRLERVISTPSTVSIAEAIPV